MFRVGKCCWNFKVGRCSALLLRCSRAAQVAPSLSYNHAFLPFSLLPNHQHFFSTQNSAPGSSEARIDPNFFHCRLFKVSQGCFVFYLSSSAAFRQPATSTSCPSDFCEPSCNQKNFNASLFLYHALLHSGHSLTSAVTIEVTISTTSTRLSPNLPIDKQCNLACFSSTATTLQISNCARSMFSPASIF